MYMYEAAAKIAGTHDIDMALQVVDDSVRAVTEAEFAALGVPGDKAEQPAHLANLLLSAYKLRFQRLDGASPTVSFPKTV